MFVLRIERDNQQFNNIEMQLTDNKNMKRRTLFYLSKIICQLNKIQIGKYEDLWETYCDGVL